MNRAIRNALPEFERRQRGGVDTERRNDRASDAGLGELIERATTRLERWREDEELARRRRVDARIWGDLERLSDAQLGELADVISDETSFAERRYDWRRRDAMEVAARRVNREMIRRDEQRNAPVEYREVVNAYHDVLVTRGNASWYETAAGEPLTRTALRARLDAIYGDRSGLGSVQERLRRLGPLAYVNV